MLHAPPGDVPLGESRPARAAVSIRAYIEYHIDSEIVVHEIHQQGAALKKPHSIAEVLECLETCRCTQVVQLIRERLAL
jgi:hypothetical protein